MNQEKRMTAPCEFGHENSRNGGDLGHRIRIGRFQCARVRCIVFLVTAKANIIP